MFMNNKFISHSSRDWKVLGQDADRFSSWWRAISCFIDGGLLPVASHGRRGCVFLLLNCLLPNCFPKWLHDFTFLLTVDEGSPCRIFLMICSLNMVSPFNFSYSSRWIVVLNCDLIFISLMPNDAKHHFMCLLGVCFMKYLFKSVSCF